jgi:iron complex outermembrane receptor protein
MAYALYSRGYKPGGFNTVVTTITDWQRGYVVSQGGNGSVTFDQERLDNYEVGLKSTFLENRARVAISLYYDKWLDGQVPNQISVPADPTLPPGGTNTARIVSPVTNAGKIDLYGVEAQADFQITAKLLANLTFAYNGTDVKHYETCSDCLQILGTRTADGSVPNAPKVTGAAGLTYTDDLIDDWQWFSRADYTYRGKMFIDYTNLAWVQASNRVNLTLGVEKEQLRVTAFVRNVTNNSTPPSVTRITNGFFNFFPPNQHSINYSLPDKRAYGVSASYDF